MADRYLLESGAPDGYLLESGSGVLILDIVEPVAAWALRRPQRSFKRINTTHRRALTLTAAIATPIPAAPDREIAERFSTRLLPQRIPQKPMWVAAMASAVTPAPSAPDSLQRHFRVVSTRSRRFIAVRDVPSYAVAPPATSPAVPATLRTGSPPRRRTSHKRTPLAAPSVYANAAAATSADRGIEEPFETNVTRSRRLQRLPQLNVYPPTPGGPAAQPVAAWAARPLQVRRAKATHRRQRVPMSGAEVIALRVPMAAVQRAPQVNRVEFKPRLVRSRPQVLYPPTTGPPVVDVSSWATAQRRARLKTRHRLLTLPAPPSATTAPVITEPAVAWALAKSLVRKKTRHRLLRAPDAPQATSAPVITQPVSSWQLPTKLTRKKTRHRLLAPLDVARATAAPTNTVLQSWVLVRALKLKRTKFRKIRVPDPPQATTAPVLNQPPTAWALAKALKLKRTKFRKLRTPDPPQASTAPVITQAEPSWRLVSRLWRKTLRRHIVKLRVPPETTTALPPPPVPWPSWQLAKALKLRRTKFRKLRVPDPPQATSAPVITAPTTAWRLAVALKRRVTRHRALHAPDPPQNTVAPSQTAPQSWVLLRALKRKVTKHRLLKAPDPPQATSAPLPLGAISSIEPALSIRRKATRHKLRTLPIAHVFPAAVPAPPQPESALDPAKAKLRPRSQHWLVPQPPAPVFPQTPTPITAVVPVRAIKLKRTHFKVRTLVPAPKPTPTPTQASWLLKVALHRRPTARHLLKPPPPGQYKATAFVLAQPSAIMPARSIRRHETRHRLRVLKQPILRRTDTVSAIGLVATAVEVRGMQSAVREVGGADGTVREVGGMQADVK